VIARIAYFDDFDLTGRDWVLEAIADAEGFHGAYHLYDEALWGQHLDLILGRRGQPGRRTATRSRR
jgi:hypothetical protein